jgi:hypothetical protein
VAATLRGKQGQTKSVSLHNFRSLESQLRNYTDQAADKKTLASKEKHLGIPDCRENQEARVSRSMVT